MTRDLGTRSPGSIVVGKYVMLVRHLVCCGKHSLMIARFCNITGLFHGNNIALRTQGGHMLTENINVTPNGRRKCAQCSTKLEGKAKMQNALEIPLQLDSVLQGLRLSFANHCHVFFRFGTVYLPHDAFCLACSALIQSLGETASVS